MLSDEQAKGKTAPPAKATKAAPPTSDSDSESESSSEEEKPAPKKAAAAVNGGAKVCLIALPKICGGF